MLDKRKSERRSPGSSSDWRQAVSLIALVSAIFVGVCVTPTSLLQPMPALAQGTIVRCEPVAVGGPPSAILTVDLYVENVADLNAADLQLSFDTTIAQVADADPGTPGIQIEPLSGFLSPDWVGHKEADNAAGTIRYAVAQVAKPSVNGSGSLARVSFQAVTVGSFTMPYTSADLRYPTGTRIPATTKSCTISFCNPALEVWVDDGYSPGGANDGHTWHCDAFDSIQDAIDAVASGGKIKIKTGTYSENLVIGKNLTLQGGSTPVLDAGGGDAVTVNGGSVTIKGLTIQNADTAFTLTGGTLTAYANNIASCTTALSNSGGTFNGKHNWWGTYDTKPSGLDDASWDARLGADIESWADGSGSATLDGASISGGAGTAVIVNHGRECPDDAPFGNSITTNTADMCSDYYDFFTIDGGGTWSIQVPVDDNSNCNDNTRDGKKIFWITDVTQCIPATIACWDLIPPADVSISGQNLVVSGLSVADLGGTPFATGDAHGMGPTAVTLSRFRATSTSAGWANWLSLALLAVAVCALSLYYIRMRTG